MTIASTLKMQWQMDQVSSNLLLEEVWEGGELWDGRGSGMTTLSPRCLHDAESSLDAESFLDVESFAHLQWQLYCSKRGGPRLQPCPCHSLSRSPASALSQWSPVPFVYRGGAPTPSPAPIDASSCSPRQNSIRTPRYNRRRRKVHAGSHLNTGGGKMRACFRDSADNGKKAF